MAGAARTWGTRSRTAGQRAQHPRRVAHAVKVLTADVRLASVVRAAPDCACAASQDRNSGRLNPCRPPPGARSSRKPEQ